MADKTFKLDYSAATFPSGQIEKHELILENAPSYNHVVGLFHGIMPSDTSTLHDIQEVREGDYPQVRRMPYPENRR